jgi:hypothetical protein
MTRDNRPYGLGNMYRVLRHETCHTFGAADEKEWSDDCRGTDDCYVKWGYFQIENSNCYYCPGEQEQCLMHNLFSEDICIWTRHQLGWRDSDGDGPADPIDPNSHRYCWIGANEVGPAYFGDKIKVWTIDDEPEFVKSIVVTPDNCQPRDDGCCAVMRDGTNAWGEACAPGIYIATVNDGSSHSILLRAIDPNSTSRPAFSNIQFENGVLYWRLDDCWAYVRLKIYNSSNQLVLYPIKDKVYLPNVYYGNDHYQTDLYGLIEGTTYTAEFFGWCPPGHRSDTTRYSFVFHGPAVLSPNGGELWQAQTTYDITWNFPGVSGNVKIQYSTDGGATWKTIAGSTSNDGTYSWTLPCFCDTLPACRIKVSDWEDGIPWDVSDDDFSIVPPYTITPSNLTGSQSAPDRVTLNWQDNDDNEAGFTIYCDGCLCGAVGPNVTTYIDSGLIPGRSYLYWVKAYYEPCESSPSNADTVFLNPFWSFSPPGEFPIDNNIPTFPDMRDGDTVQLRVGATIVYPGHFKEVRVSMNNPVPISGFNLLIKSSSLKPNLVKFHTVDISQDSILIGSDWVDYPVRECFIDTTGSLIGNFNSLFSRGQPADTTLPDCKYLWLKAWAKPGSPIPPSNGNFLLLFKFGVDLSCICDADTMRKVYFDIPFAYFVDTLGYTLPFTYDPIGELFAWWSVPGDANNDSAVDAADVVYLVNHLYLHGPRPCVMESGDVDSTGEINATDAVYLQNYLYLHGPRPKRGYGCAKKEENQTSTFSK